MTLRTVSVALQARLESNNTSPCYLVELVLSSITLRYCSFGTLPWNSLTWQGKNMEVGGMGSNNPPTIVLFDEDAALRTLMLTDSMADRPVKVWHGDADTLIGSPQGDPLLLFSGVGGAMSWARGKVTLRCARANSISTLCPRTRMTAETGYNFLAPKGTEFQWGDKIVRLD